MRERGRNGWNRVAQGLFYSLIFFTLLSCNTKRYLVEDQRFLRRNTVTLSEPTSEGKLNKKITEQLGLLIPLRQRPNAYLLGAFPIRRWMYYKTLGAKGKGIKRWMSNQVAENPVFLDSMGVVHQVEDMQAYLRTLGYFNNEVTYQIQKGKNNANVIFIVAPKAPMRITHIGYSTNDSIFQPYLNGLMQTSLLKKDEILTQGGIEKERQRITNFFRNKGYYDFSPSDIPAPSVDTARGSARISLEIKPPVLGAKVPYTIDGILVAQKLAVTPNDSLVRDTTIDCITYLYPPNGSALDLSVIEERIALKPGQTYNVDQLQRTVKQLDDLGTFRFVNVQLLPDSTKPRSLRYQILLPPAKRMSLSAGLDINFSSTTSVRNTIGGALTTSFAHNNLLGKAEALQINSNVGVDLALRNQFQSSAEVGFDAQLRLPRLHDAQLIWRLLDRTRLVNPLFMTALRRNGTTSYGAGYNFRRLLDYYGFHSFDAGYGVKLKQSRTNYSLQQSALNLFIPIEYTRFDTFISGREYLRRSLSPQLITAFVFHQFRVNHVTKSNNNSEPFKVNFLIEQSGLEFAAVNAVINQFRDSAVTPKLFGDVNFAQYIKTEIDVTQTIKLSGKRAIAYRGGAGVIFNLAKDQQTPYLRQFYLGGPYSVRAWRIRGLGPGAFRDSISSDPNSSAPAYQAADLKFEGNFEYRFPLILMFESAFFLDGGNIWTLRKEEDRKEGVVSGQFYKQIALGGGVGLRLDANFVLIRLDFAYPFRQPYPDESGRYWEQPVNFDRRKINYNLAINYPF